MIDYTGTFKTIQDVVDWINNYTPESGVPGYLKVDEYDSSEYHYPSENVVYEVGDHAVYEDNLYVCTIRVTVLDEPFDTNKWTLMDTIPEQVFTKPGKILADDAEIFNSLSTNIATGFESHAEGYSTKATNHQAHAEGNNTTASGYSSHAEGNGTTASSDYTHAEGGSTIASASGAHAEGYNTKATANYTHAEGYQTEANGQNSHAEGNRSKTYSNASSAHVEGEGCEASGYYAHVEGFNCKDYGYNNHVEGQACEAGSSTRMCHVEGYGSKALNTAEYAHAEGYYCEAKSQGTHAGGYSSQTLGYCSFTHGDNTKSNVAYEASFGRYNATSDDGSSYSWWGSWNSYSTGDIVNHSNDGNIYRANQDIPLGTAWDATMWDIIGTYATDPADIIQFSYGYGSSNNSRTNLFDVRRNGDGYLGGNKIITNAIIPDPPTTDGTYTLQCTVTNGVATYAWV